MKHLYMVTSGEGTGPGHTEIAYTTAHGIKLIARKLHCDGDRWVKCEHIYDIDTDGDVNGGRASPWRGWTTPTDDATMLREITARHGKMTTRVIVLGTMRSARRTASIIGKIADSVEVATMTKYSDDPNVTPAKIYLEQDR